MKQFSWKNKFYILLSYIVFIVIWEIIATKINNEIYLPKVHEIAKSIAGIITERDFFKIILSTFYRTILSYGIALSMAVILGVLSSTCPLFYYLFNPINSFFKTIPTLVLIVLALVWFDKDKAPYIVGFAIVLPILYEGIRNSFNEIDKNIIEMTKIYEVGFKDKLLKIYLQKMKFYLMSIFVSTFSLAFKVVIAGEVHGQPKYGMGSQIQIEKVNFNTSGIFAWIIIIVLISLIFEIINLLLRKRVYRWKNSEDIY
ncbi:MAG: ABC transporter permease subunit [Clostridium butyricum]|nr:ABC transporter permease subunit [Clostridium butyricum]